LFESNVSLKQKIRSITHQRLNRRRSGPKTSCLHLSDLDLFGFRDAFREDNLGGERAPLTGPAAGEGSHGNASALTLARHSVEQRAGHRDLACWAQTTRF